MWSLLLAMALGSDGRGEETPAMVRVHGEASAAGGAMISTVTPGYGPGAHLEAGVVLADTWVISARATAVSIITSGFLALGTSFATKLGAHFTLGGGVSWCFISPVAFDLPAGAAIVTPIRLTYRLGADETRSGVVFGAELIPGVVYAATAGRSRPPPTPAFAFGGLVTAGYAWW